jgi:GNAT superfamily N-acetyltransferase
VAEITMTEVTTLTAEQRTALFGWGSNIWGSHVLGGKKLWCAPPQRRFVRWVDGQPVSHVGVQPVTATVRPQPMTPPTVEVELQGIGTVITPAAHQGQGHASALLTDVLARLTAEGAHTAMIFCLPHRVGWYRRLGWTPVAATVEVGQPGGRRVVEAPYTVLYQGLQADPVAYPLPLVLLPSPRGYVRIEGRPW